MESIKQYINHPLSKCIISALIGGGLLLEGHLKQWFYLTLSLHNSIGRKNRTILAAL